MLDQQQDVATEAARWLAAFEQALTAVDVGPLAALFHADSHWRDSLALTGDIRTVSGRDALVEALRIHASNVRPQRFAIDPQRTPPRRVMRAGSDAIEAIF